MSMPTKLARETITMHHITPERTLLVMDFSEYGEPEHLQAIRRRNEQAQNAALDRWQANQERKTK